MTTPDPREALSVILEMAEEGASFKRGGQPHLGIIAEQARRALAQAAPPPDPRFHAPMSDRIAAAQAAPPPKTVTFDHDGSDRPVDGFGIVEAAPPPVHRHDYGAAIIPCSQDHGAAPPSGLDVLRPSNPLAIDEVSEFFKAEALSPTPDPVEGERPDIADAPGDWNSVPDAMSADR